MNPFDSAKYLRQLHFLPLPHTILLAILATGLLLLALTEQPEHPGQLVTLQTIAQSEFTTSQPADIAIESQALAAIAETASIDPEPAEPETDSRLYTEVRPGDNLSLIFGRMSLSAQEVYRITHSDADSDILTRLYPGYELVFDINEEGLLQELEVLKTPLESIVFTRTEGNNFISEKRLRQPEIKQSYKEALIDDSLFMAAQKGGISADITMEMANIFGGVIDFILDTRRGDSFNVLYDEKYLDGQYVDNGVIQAAQYTNRGEIYTALRYENLDGEVDYYNPDGESMRKAFLRNPVDFVRISSNFNPNRRHPILNTIRAHKGTDYAAPQGTPVVATSDGRVSFAGRKGSFGNLVVIQHGQQFQTKYAHLSAFARGVKGGTRVKQGQIIGYVGATGGATGPHLHYEFLMNGVHRNYRTIHDQLPKAESVAAEEMERFLQHTQILMSNLENYTSHTSTLAMSGTSSND